MLSKSYMSVQHSRPYSNDLKKKKRLLNISMLERQGSQLVPSRLLLRAPFSASIQYTAEALVPQRLHIADLCFQGFVRAAASSPSFFQYPQTE